MLWGLIAAMCGCAFWDSGLSARATRTGSTICWTGFWMDWTLDSGLDSGLDSNSGKVL